MKGQVLRVKEDKGFGFIRTNDDEDYFYHRSACNGKFNDIYQAYLTGQPILVEFDPVETNKGMRAENVRMLHD